MDTTTNSIKASPVQTVLEPSISATSVIKYLSLSKVKCLIMFFILILFFPGLQQHAIIHTDQKPFTCEICSKSFRFKSNLFEHRSVHSGFTPHACPYCGKTCRLKGNLKKHLKTHVSTKEELDAAWKPFARFLFALFLICIT